MFPFTPAEGTVSREAEQICGFAMNGILSQETSGYCVALCGAAPGSPKHQKIKRTNSHFCQADDSQAPLEEWLAVLACSFGFKVLGYKGGM